MLFPIFLTAFITLCGPLKLCSATEDDGLYLLTAAMNGQYEDVKNYLESGVDADFIDPWNYNALALAVENNRTNVLPLLLNHTTKINHEIYPQWTALHMAAQSGYLEAGKLLLEYGANLSIANPDGWSPLYTAIFENHTDFALMLLNEYQADPSVYVFEYGPTLNLAVQYSHSTALIKALLKNGARVNSVDYNLNTPLIEAVQLPSVPLARLLLNKGADVNFDKNLGWTPLHFAVLSDFKGDVIKLLLNRGANVNATTQDLGVTPLHLAAEVGNVAAAKLLLSAAADTDAPAIVADHPELSGFTPLHFAAYFGQTKVARILVNSGADIEAIAPSSLYTPLHAAALNNSASVTKFLSNHGALLSALSVDNKTALQLAETLDYSDLIKFLQP